MFGELWNAASHIAMDENANGSRIPLLGTPYGPTDNLFRKAFEAGWSVATPTTPHSTGPTASTRIWDHAYLER